MTKVEEVARASKQASELGLKRYYTGQPCSRGHLAERVASSRACVECLSINRQVCRERGIDRFKTLEAEQRQKHAARISLYASRRYAEQPERVKAASKKWRENNKSKEAERNARRKAAKLKATPAWAKLNLISDFYRLAADMTRETGIQYEVDHVIPLQSPVVCGLHVEANLQILTKSENSRKRNKLGIDAALQEGE